MNNKLTTSNPLEAESTLLEKVVIGGDLSPLNARERMMYYSAICKSLKLNPLTQPFSYLTLKGKMVLYARKDCTDQLRRIHNISLDKPETHIVADDVFVVTITARTPDGRCDTDIGATSIKGLKSDDLCNAMMRSITKAKRRVTLAICGLGALDESELETIKGAKPMATYFDDDEPWRKWRTPDDAILWAGEQLPHMTLDEIQSEFNAMPSVAGKKAPSWIAKVDQLMRERF